MADALYQSKLIGNAFFVVSQGFSSFLFKLTAVWSWEMQFLTDKLTVFPKTTKFTNFHRPHLVFPDFQGLEKLLFFFFFLYF